MDNNPYRSPETMGAGARASRFRSWRRIGLWAIGAYAAAYGIAIAFAWVFDDTQPYVVRLSMFLGGLALVPLGAFLIFRGCAAVEESPTH